MTKYSEVNPEDQNIINTTSYLMAIDCENRLFSKLPVNGEIKQVKNWENPINDKLIKKTIILYFIFIRYLFECYFLPEILEHKLCVWAINIF